MTMRRGRPLRTAQRITEARRRDNARRGAAAANAKREPVVFDWDRAIDRLKAMLDNLEERK